MEAASAFQDLIASGRCAELIDPVGQINGYASMEFSSADYLQVQRVRTVLQKQVDRLFDEFDVLATAGESSAASLLDSPPEGDSEGPIERRAPDAISSLCGLPAITVPCGFSKNHLPFGVQFIGRALNDHTVIEAAHLFQRDTDWHRQRPPIAFTFLTERKTRSSVRAATVVSLTEFQAGGSNDSENEPRNSASGEAASQNLTSPESEKPFSQDEPQIIEDLPGVTSLEMQFRNWPELNL